MEREGSPVLDMAGAAEAGDPTRVVCPEDHAGSFNNGCEIFMVSQEEEESTTTDPSEASQSYLFGPSMLTVSHIHEMASLRYFAEGDARVPGEEVILEAADDEDVVFEEFFVPGLCMPPCPALADIVFKF
jgi:hypothetical protein